MLCNELILEEEEYDRGWPIQWINPVVAEDFAKSWTAMYESVARPLLLLLPTEEEK